MKRRTALRLAGAGAVGSLAGCVGNGDGDDDVETGAAIAETATIQLATRTSSPRWHSQDSEKTGHVVVAGSEVRSEAVLNQYGREMDEGRTRDLGAFMEAVNYSTDRLLLVESSGPTACHDRVDVEDVRVEDELLRAEATAVDASDDDDCEEVTTYPSVLVRVTFEEYPLDEAAVTVTDGWGETATVTASADDSLSPDPVELSGHIRPDEDAEPVEPLVCEDEEFERLPQEFDEDGIRMGDLESDGEVVLSMRVGSMEYARGDTVQVSLTNVSEREIQTGNGAKFNLQVYTEEGWQDVRGAGELPVAYTEEAVVHYPGGGFEWTFELTESGVVEHGPDDLAVCPGLEPGRYRFAFWGLPAGEEALAVEFDVVD